MFRGLGGVGFRLWGCRGLREASGASVCCGVKGV